MVNWLINVATPVAASSVLIYSHLCDAVGYSCSKNMSSWLPMKIALVGGDAYISAVLRPYVEFFSTKSPDWLTYIRFLVVPFGESVYVDR